MARQKERSLEQLLRNTTELFEFRASCVLDGKARMRGPGVLAFSKDTECRKVCTTCGSQIRETEFLACGTCDQVLHAYCVDQPTKVSSGGNWVCCQCQGKDVFNSRHEADLDPSFGTHGQNVLACNSEITSSRQDEMARDEQSVPVRDAEDGSKTLGQPQTGPTEVPGVNHVDVYGEVKHEDDEGSSQVGKTVEYVRRSKRGRPYRPVGGLRPNKRRTINNPTKDPDKHVTARSSIDEEDELGAKIEKFRVISSIDEDSVKNLSSKVEAGGGTLKTLGESADLQTATLHIGDNTNMLRTEVVVKLEQASLVDDTVAANVLVNQGFGNESSPTNMEVESTCEVRSLAETLGFNVVGELHPSINCTRVETPGNFVAQPNACSEMHLSTIANSVKDVDAESVEIGNKVSDVIRKESRNQLSGMKKNDREKSNGVQNGGECPNSPVCEKVPQPPFNSGQVTSILSVESSDNSKFTRTQSPDGSNSILDTNAGKGAAVCVPLPTFSESNAIRSNRSSSATNADLDCQPLQSSPTSVLRGNVRAEDVPPTIESALTSVVQADSSMAASQLAVKGAPEGCPSSTSPTTVEDGKYELAREGSLNVGKELAKTSKQEDESAETFLRSLQTTDILSAVDRNVFESPEAGDTSQSVDASHERGCNQEAENGSICQAPTATPASPIVHTGGNPDDSSGVKSSGSSPVAASDISEEVKVCDICGDAGYEECLAVCSACNEGAEHIYCMQALLHAVPDDGWLCEGCKSKKMAGPLKEMDASHYRAHLELIHPINKKSQFMKSSSRARLSARLDKGKGNALRIAGTKGLQSHHLNLKRLASDTLSNPAKRQVLESPDARTVGPNAILSRVLTKETSFKAPDSGKVKFLSQDALASISVGSGSRQSSKTAGSRGMPSPSPRSGASQLLQAPSKDKFAANNSVLIDGHLGAACIATKQLPLTSRQSSLAAKAPSLFTGRGSGSFKTKEPLPLSLLSSKSGYDAFAKGNQEGCSDGNGLNSMGTGTGNGIGCQGIEGGATGRSARKMALKLVDTPRPSSQLPGFPRPCHTLQIDPPICFIPCDSSEMAEKPISVTKRGQISDTSKLTTVSGKRPSSSVVENNQVVHNETDWNRERQDVRSPREDFEPVRSSGSVKGNSSSSTKLQSFVSRRPAEDVQDLRRGQRKSPVEESENSTGLTEWHRDCARILSGEGLVSTSCKPARESVISSQVTQNSAYEMANGIKGSRCNGKEWFPSTHLTSKTSTRCYKCKEIRHPAHDCGDQRAGTSGRADICSGDIATRSLLATSKDDLMTSVSRIAGQKAFGVHFLEDQKDVHSDVFSSQETERAGPVPLRETHAAVRQKTVSMPHGGHHEEPLQKSSPEARHELSSLRAENASKTSGQHKRSPSGGFGEDLNFTGAGKANDSPDGMLAVLTSGMKHSVPVPLGTGNASAGFPGLDTPRHGVLKELPRPEIGARGTNDPTVRPSNGGAQVPWTAVRTLSGQPTLAPVFPHHPSYAAAPPSMVLQPKGLGPWGPQVAPSPPVPAIGRMASQDVRGVQTRAPHGFRSGPPPCHTFGSPRASAVPESQWLWRGRFEVVSAEVPAVYDGLQAYPSSVADPKVSAVTKTLPPTLQLEEVKRMFNADAWPKQFQQKPPTGNEIALYFFPGCERFEPAYMKLLKHMMAEDLVLMGNVEGAEILIFPSHLLPLEHHRWKNKMFLWGVYRARKSNPSVASTPLTSGQIFPNTSLQSAVKVEVSDRREGSVKSGISFDGDTREVDMEIDMIGTKELDVVPKPAQTSVWSTSSLLSSPPLPVEPPPVQPPPPGFGTCLQEAKAVQQASSKEFKACCSVKVDLPPSFRPQKRVPLQDGPSIFGFKSGGHPGLHQPGEGAATLPGNIDDSALAGTPRRAKPDFPTEQLTQKQDRTPAGYPVTTVYSRQVSPSLPSCSASKDWKDGLVTARQNGMQSQSSIQSPNGRGDQMKDWTMGTGRFSRRESGNQRESASDRAWEEVGASGSGREWERGRIKGRDWDGERDWVKGRDRNREKESERNRQKVSNRRNEKEAWWEDKEQRRQRWLDREREDRDDTFSLERSKHSNSRYRHDDALKNVGKDYQSRRCARSCSLSESRSRSLSSSRQKPQQSPSVSPTSRQNSGRWYFKLQSTSRSNSPDSSDRRRRKGPRSGEGSGGRSQDESTPRRVTSRWDSMLKEAGPTQRVAPCHELSQKATTAPVSDTEELGITQVSGKDLTEGVSLPCREVGEGSSFYIGHKNVKGDRKVAKEVGGQDPVSFYRVILPAESHEAQLSETKAKQDKPHRQQSTEAVSATNLEDILNHPPSAAPCLSNGPWEPERSAESSGYQFFPMTAQDDKEHSRASSKKKPVEMDDGEGLVPQSSDFPPFFVPLVDEGKSLGGDVADRGCTQLIGESQSRTLEFPLVTETNLSPGTSAVDVGSLNLTLSVPQYRKEGNAWVKLKDADALLGDEDVDFALTL